MNVNLVFVMKLSKQPLSMPLFTKFLGLLLLLVLTNFSAKATHVMGADIEYRDLGGDSILVKVNVYRDCNGVNMSNSAINFSGACSGIVKSAQTMSAGKDITPVCSNQCTRCDSRSCSFAYGIEKRTLSVIIKVDRFKKNGCCDINISWSQCCRNGAITTGSANQNFYVFAEMNVCVSGGNSSPEFIGDPLSLICLNQDVVLSIGGIDPDTTNNGKKADSVFYSFARPLMSNGSPTSWISPYTYDKPIKYYGFPNSYNSNRFPFGIHLDHHSGELMFRPTQIQQTIISIRAVQFRNGNKIGSTTRDMQVVVIKCPNNSSPVISGINCTTPSAQNLQISACVGQPICFNICTSDKDKDDTVTIAWNNGLPDATFKILNPGSKREKATVCWTPQPKHANNGFYYFIIYAIDNACPANGIAARSFRVYVTSNKSFDYHMNQSVVNKSCGSIQLSGYSSDSVKSKNIDWYVFDTVPIHHNSAVDTTSFTYSFAKDGTYPIKAVVNRGGCFYDYYDTVVVSGVKPITINVNDTSVCTENEFILPLSAQGGNGNFSFYWRDFYNTNWTSSDTLNVQLNSSFRDFETKTYYVEAIDQAGCKSMSSFNLFRKKANALNLENDRLICDDNVEIKLQTSSSTSGASWIGTGVSNNVFSNKNLNTGIYELSYYDELDSSCYYDNATFKYFGKPTVKAGPDLTGCPQMGNVQLNASPSGGSWYGWRMSKTGYFTPIGRLTGPYTFYYSYTDANGCNNRDTVILTIVNETSTLNIGNDTTLCKTHNPLLLSATPTGGIWTGKVDLQGGNYYFDPSSKTPSIGYPITYTYTDSLGCKTSRSKKMSVFKSPTISAGADLSECFYNTDTIRLQGKPTGGQWSGLGMAGSSGEIVTSSAYIGTNEFTYTYTDNNGCIGVDKTNFTLNEPPIVDAGGDDTVCVVNNDKYRFTATPLGGVWNGPGMTNSSDHFVIINTNTVTPAPYTYVYTDANGCKDSDEVILFIGKQPKADFSPSVSRGEVPLSVSFTNNSQGYSWLWNFGDGNSSTDKEPSYVFRVEGSYNVKLTATDSSQFCSNSTSRTIIVDKMGGIAGIDNPSIEVYPTITNGKLHITSELNKTCTVLFYSQNGDVIEALQLENQLEISTSNWAKGLYYYKISNTEELLEMGKVVVE
ncbi:MAG: PKD domain-containing protein [Bacteroidetes bacterium]|nr:PKD domain-containing protein [Bacteroidota bacterium]